jgi:hypothetical protein
VIGVTRRGEPEATLYAEKRFTTAAAMMMTEAAIDGGFTRDLYAALGEELGNGAWAVRLYYKPFVRWIWAGSADGAGRGCACAIRAIARAAISWRGGQMKRCTLLMPLVIFMAIAMLLLWQLARNVEGDDPNSLESALIGKPVPIFRLEALEDPGQYFQSDALAQGKPLLLNVWATWCPTCRAEHQYLNQLSARGSAWWV